MSPGTWANDFLEDNPNCTALVLENVLRLDTRSRSGQIAQRLGLYMALQWRTKFLNNNGGQAHRIATLLTAVGIDPKTITNREERRRIRAYLTGEAALSINYKMSGPSERAMMQAHSWTTGATRIRKQATQMLTPVGTHGSNGRSSSRAERRNRFLQNSTDRSACRLEEGVARKRRKERASDAAQARRIAEKD
jgi:hypothetical protein